MFHPVCGHNSPRPAWAIVLDEHLALDEWTWEFRSRKLHFLLPHSTRQSYAHFYTRFHNSNQLVGREISLGMLGQTLIFSFSYSHVEERPLTWHWVTLCPTLHSFRVGGASYVGVWPPVNHVPPPRRTEPASVHRSEGLWPSPLLPRASVRLARLGGGSLLLSGPHAVTYSSLALWTIKLLLYCPSALLFLGFAFIRGLWIRI